MPLTHRTLIRLELATVRTIPSQTQCARFSRCSRLRDDNDARTTKPTTASRTQRETPNGPKEQQTKDGPKKRKSGFSIPALAITVLGLPLGYYLKSRYDQERGTKLSDPNEFVKYTLVGKDNVSSTCAIFRLRPATNTQIDQDDPALERAITSVEFKQPQLQIARSYTCLPQQDGQHMDELRFLIRREQKGEVSNFLHRLPVNSEIEARGLHSEYELPEDVKSVAFLVGGTGIAPAVQAADKLEGQADIHIIWANRLREDCIGGFNDTVQKKSSWSLWPRSSTPTQADRSTTAAEKGALVSILEKLKRESTIPNEQRSRLSVDYFVDEEGTAIRPDNVKNLLNTLSTADGSSSTGKKILFVSGPEGFISHWAGPKQWAKGREVQGPLRGVLSTLDLKGWEVVKL